MNALAELYQQSDVLTRTLGQVEWQRKEIERLSGLVKRLSEDLAAASKVIDEWSMTANTTGA